MVIIILSVIIALSFILYKLYQHYDNKYDKTVRDENRMKDRFIHLKNAQDKLNNLNIEEDVENINLKSVKKQNFINKLKNKIQEKKK